jgi:hypothetical protein
MELDLPTGTGGNNGGDHLAKFLSTLTQLVDVLGKTGPVGGGGAGSTVGGGLDATGGKNLVKATQKLFNDLANAFKPLKQVLATFSTIHPPTASTPTPATTPSGNRLNDPKYDGFFDGPPTPPKPEATPTAAPTPPTPQAQPQDDTPLPKGALTIEDASIGIDYASVKMPAPPAPKKKAEPKADEPTLVKSMNVDTNSVKVTVPTASFKIANALLEGKFMMPPEAATANSKPASASTPETETTSKPEPAQATPIAQPASATPAIPKPQSKPQPNSAATKSKNAQGESGKQLLTWTNVFARLIGAADERKRKPAGKNNDTQEKNANAQETAQNLQNAIINIANGVVNVTTGGQSQQEKPQQEQQQQKPQQQRPQQQGKPNAGKGKPSLMPSPAGKPKPSPTPTAGGPKGPKLNDPRVAILITLAKLATGMNQAMIAGAHKIVDGAQKSAQLVGSGVAAPFQEVGKKVMAGAGMLTKAFSDPLGAFQDLTQMMIGFVQVVNPATVMQFNRAMTDVSAIIGKALAPALAIATQVVRELGDLMAPLYEAITPFITMIARAFGDMFISMVRIAAMIGQLLMPVTKSLYIVLAGLAKIVTAVLEAMTVLLAGFLGTFDGLDGLVQSAVDAIVDFSKWIMRAAISVAVLVAKMFGATQFIANMQKIAGNKGATTRSDSTGQAAPTMSQFQSAESFGKNIAQASFTATAVPDAPKKTDDFLATISEDINGLAQIDLKQLIVDAILQAGKDAVKNTAKAAGETAYDYNPLKIPGEAIGNLFGKLLFG